MDINLTIKENSTLVNNAITDFIPAPKDGQDSVVDAMKYSLINGGKRLRPLLVRLFAKACGGGEDVCNVDILPFACAVEMIHTYSLIHDDLPCMDDDDFRRGNPSCHKKFGEATALLAGDALLTLAFETITSEKYLSGFPQKSIVKVVSVLSKNAGVSGMIGGQVVDLANEKISPTLEQVSTVNLLKTGALIEASCLIGGILAGATDNQINSIKIFANKLGLAFQIQDDILDVIGDENLLGKQIGSDAENNKSTFVSILGLEKSKELVSTLTDEAVSALNVFGSNKDELCALAYHLVSREF